MATEQKLRDRTAALALEVLSAETGFRGAGPGEFRDIIQAAQIVAQEADQSLQRWALAARREGMSWAEVGGALGISKQAAQQKFRTTLSEPLVASPDQIEVRLGATAFNEERLLDMEGRRGNELVGVGLLSLTFRRTLQVWEYRRLVSVTAAAAQATAAAQGWVYVASWFPFHYFKRSIPAAGDVQRLS